MFYCLQIVIKMSENQVMLQKLTQDLNKAAGYMAEDRMETALNLFQASLQTIVDFMRSEEYNQESKGVKSKVFSDAAKCVQQAKVCMDNLSERLDRKYEKYFYENHQVEDIRGDTFDTMIGLEHVRDQLMEEIVIPFICPNLYKNKQRKQAFVLSFGPPGTYKTAACHALYNILKKHIKKFFFIGHDFINQKWKGDSAKAVTAAFRVMRNHKPSMLLIDECESILATNEHSNHDDGVIGCLLRELDPKKVENEGLIVFCCTNHPEKLAPGFDRRFSSILYHGMPSKQVVNQ